MAKEIKVGDKIETVYGEKVEVVKVEPLYGRLEIKDKGVTKIIREGQLMFLVKGGNGTLTWFPPNKIK